MRKCNKMDLSHQLSLVILNLIIMYKYNLSENGLYLLFISILTQDEKEQHLDIIGKSGRSEICHIIFYGC